MAWDSGGESGAFGERILRGSRGAGVDRRSLCYFANAFAGIDGVQAAGIDVLGDAHEHGLDLGAVIEDGFDVMTIG